MILDQYITFLDSEMVADTKNLLAEDKYNKINVETSLFLYFGFAS